MFKKRIQSVSGRFDVTAENIQFRVSYLKVKCLSPPLIIIQSYTVSSSKASVSSLSIVFSIVSEVFCVNNFGKGHLK